MAEVDINKVISIIDKTLDEGEIVISPREYKNLGELLHNRIFSDESGFNAFSRVIMAYLEAVGRPDLKSPQAEEAAEKAGKNKHAVEISEEVFAQNVLPHETKRSTGVDSLYLFGRVVGLSATLGDARALLRSIGADFWQLRPEATFEDMHWDFEIEAKKTTLERAISDIQGHTFNTEELLTLNSSVFPRLIGEKGGKKGFIDFIKRELGDKAGEYDIFVVSEDELKNGFEDLIKMVDPQRKTIVFTSMREGVSVEIPDVKALHIDYSVRSTVDQLQSMGRFNNSKTEILAKGNTRTPSRYKQVVMVDDDPELTLEMRDNFREHAAKMAEAEGDDALKQQRKTEAEGYLRKVMDAFSAHKAETGIVQALQGYESSSEKIEQAVKEYRKASMFDFINQNGEKLTRTENGTYLIPRVAGGYLEVQLDENRNDNGYKELAVRALNADTHISKYVVLQQGQVYDITQNAIYSEAQWAQKPQDRGKPIAALLTVEVPIEANEKQDFSKDAPQTELRMVRVDDIQDVEGVGHVAYYQMPFIHNGVRVYAKVPFVHHAYYGQWSLDKGFAGSKTISVVQRQNDQETPLNGFENLRIEESKHMDQQYYRFFDANDELMAIAVEGHLFKMDQEARKKLKEMQKKDLEKRQSFEPIMIGEVSMKRQVFFGAKRGHEYLRGKTQYKIDANGELVAEEVRVTNEQPIVFKGISIRLGDRLLHSKNTNEDDVWEVVDHLTGKSKALIINNTAVPLIDGHRAQMQRDFLRLVHNVDGKDQTIETPSIHEYTAVVDSNGKKTWEPLSMVIDTRGLESTLGLAKGSRVYLNSGLVITSEGKTVGIYYQTFFHKFQPVKDHPEMISVDTKNKYIRDDLVGLGFLTKEQIEQLNQGQESIEINRSQFIQAVASANGDVRKIKMLGNFARHTGDDSKVIVELTDEMEKLLKKRPDINVERVKDGEKVYLKITPKGGQGGRFFDMMKFFQGKLTERAKAQIEEHVVTEFQEEAKGRVEASLSQYPMEMVFDPYIEGKGTAGLADNKRLSLGINAMLDVLQLTPDAMEAGVPEHEVSHIVERLLALNGIRAVGGASRITNLLDIAQGLDRGIYTGDYSLGEVYTHWIEAAGKIANARRALALGDKKTFTIFINEAVKVLERSRNIALSALDTQERALEVIEEIEEAEKQAGSPITYIPGILQIKTNEESRLTKEKPEQAVIVVQDTVTGRALARVTQQLPLRKYRRQGEEGLTQVQMAKKLIMENIEYLKFRSALTNVKVQMMAHFAQDERAMKVLERLETLTLNKMKEEFSGKGADYLETFLRVLGNIFSTPTKPTLTKTNTTIYTNEKTGMGAEFNQAGELVGFVGVTPEKIQNLDDMRAQFTKTVGQAIQKHREAYQVKEGRFSTRLNEAAALPMEGAQDPRAVARKVLKEATGQGGTAFVQLGNSDMFAGVVASPELLPGIASMVNYEGTNSADMTIYPGTVLPERLAKAIAHNFRGVNTTASKLANMANGVKPDRRASVLPQGDRDLLEFLVSRGYIELEHSGQYKVLREAAIQIQVQPQSGLEKEFEDTFFHEYIHGLYETDKEFRAAINNYLNSKEMQHSREVFNAAYRTQGYLTSEGEKVEREEFIPWVADLKTLLSPLEHFKKMSEQRIEELSSSLSRQKVDDLLSVKRNLLNADNQEFWQGISRKINEMVIQGLERQKTRSSSSTAAVSGTPAALPQPIADVFKPEPGSPAADLFNAFTDTGIPAAQAPAAVVSAPAVPLPTALDIANRPNLNWSEKTHNAEALLIGSTPKAVNATPILYGPDGLPANRIINEKPIIYAPNGLPAWTPGSSVVDSAEIVGDATPVSYVDPVVGAWVVKQAGKKFKNTHDAAMNVVKNLASRLDWAMYAPPGTGFKLTPKDSEFDADDSMQSAKDFYGIFVPSFKQLSTREMGKILAGALPIETGNYPEHGLRNVLSVLRAYAAANGLSLKAEGLEDIQALAGKGTAKNEIVSPEKRLAMIQGPEKRLTETRSCGSDCSG